ncbi:hypothetical protein U0070_017723 [Myodes glareolus]|uniref:Uncharacterized protein n=1 Tax=Myodes glareolus TaxID=447135 RepID=A0AAW0K6I6_MYOGA
MRKAAGLIKDFPVYRFVFVWEDELLSRKQQLNMYTGPTDESSDPRFHHLPVTTSFAAATFLQPPKGLIKTAVSTLVKRSSARSAQM